MAVMKTWLLLTYDLELGRRSCLGVVSCPFKPNDRTPMFSKRKQHKQKWVEFSAIGYKEVRIGFGSESVTVKAP